MKRYYLIRKEDGTKEDYLEKDLRETLTRILSKKEWEDHGIFNGKNAKKYWELERRCEEMVESIKLLNHHPTLELLAYDEYEKVNEDRILVAQDFLISKLKAGFPIWLRKYIVRYLDDESEPVYLLLDGDFVGTPIMNGIFAGTLDDIYEYTGCSHLGFKDIKDVCKYVAPSNMTIVQVISDEFGFGSWDRISSEVEEE